MPSTKLPIGVFAPDSEIVDSPSLEDAENVLPVYGSYRLVPKPQKISESGDTDTDPISGGHVHLLTEDQTIQIARPDGDLSLDNIVDQDGDTTDIYKSIDEASPDESDYIVSVATVADNTFSYDVDLTSLIDPAAPANSDHIIRFKYKSSANVTISVALHGVTDGIIDADSWIDAGDDEWTYRTYTLIDGNADAITDYTDLFIRFSCGHIPPTVSTFDPDETIGNSGNWLGDDGGSDIHTYIDDPGDDADYMVTPSMPSGATNFWCSVGLPDIIDPVTNNDHIIRLRAKYVDTDAGEVLVRLKQDQNIIASNTFTLTGSQSTQTYTLSTSEANSITDYDQLSLVVQGRNTGSATGTIEVSALELDVPQADQISLSWIEFEVPSVSSGVSKDSDLNFQYVGTKDKLYMIDPDYQWSDVTRYSSSPGDDDYAQGNDLPYSWNFASWGSDILATNYVDEIQLKGGSDTEYSNLITSPGSGEYEVRGRFLFPVSEFLVVADINNHSASGSGGSGTVGTSIANPYSVWWSGINQNTLFKIGDYINQSDYQLLVDTPGAITGGVGGEYGVIFKRNSIYRMDYVGSDLFFTFNLISVGDGTAFPRSVVKAERDIYFIGASGIQVVRDGQYVEDVGDQQITRWLMDGKYNDEALMQRTDIDTRLVDSQIFGDYNPALRCIIWFYSPTSTGKFNRERRALVYNIKENRFTKYSIDSHLPTSHYIDHYMSLKNHLTNNGPITRLDQLYVFDPSAGTHSLLHFNSRDHLPVYLKSSIISSAFFTQQEQPINIQINRVRPIFSLESLNNSHPSTTLTITSSDDPELRTTDSTTANYSRRDEDGWYPLEKPLSGEFFRFETNILATPAQYKYFLYWQIDWQAEGIT